MLAAGVAAQQPAPQFTFKSTTRLVVEAVTVTGRDGKPIAGLTAKDFVITEDKTPQIVAFCDYQHLDDSPAAPPPRVAAQAGSPTSLAITPESPGGPRYSGRRLVALYFDMTAMPVADQLRALSAAQEFVATQLHPADLVAILSYSGNGVRVRQDFTDDRDALEKVMGDLLLGAGLGLDEQGNDAASSDTGSAFGQDDSEFNVFSTNRQLAALQTAIEMLAPISEKKSLVYFASGLNLNQVDNQAQLEATTNAAVKANVQLYPEDARGLVAAAPMGDASQGSPGGMSMYNGAGAAAFVGRLARSQDTLYALGADTGGKALLDSNDLAGGIAHARSAIGDYYELGYYTSNGAQDGKYRRIRITVPGHPGARLSFRTGYYAGKVFARFTAADKERELEDALLLGNPITDLTLALAVHYFELNTAEYFVPVAVKIPGRELALAKKGGAEVSTIDFIGEVKDNYGTTISNLRDKVTLKLRGETAAQLARVPVEYNAGFTLLPGEYSIKLLARDDETGRIGTYLTNFTIPNLMKVSDRLPLSSLVLSNQRVALAAAAFNLKKNAAKDAALAFNPLVSRGVEMLPSVTRVFHSRDTLFLYLQAYEHPPATATRLEVYAGFYRNGRLMRETPIRVAAGPPQGRAGALPMTLAVPLSGLAPGKYTLQVTVLDPATQRANYCRADMAVVQ